MMHLLISRGADVDATNAEGRTALYQPAESLAGSQITTGVKGAPFERR